jgi:hypothetical protein
VAVRRHAVARLVAVLEDPDPVVLEMTFVLVRVGLRGVGAHAGTV